MEALRQSLKIGVGLVVLVGVGLAVLPERPTLLGGGGTSAAGDGGEMILAGANLEVPDEETASGEPVTVRVAQAPATATSGQQHLERLRQQRAGSAGTATPASPAPASPAPAAPAPPPAARTPAAPAPSSGGGQGLDTLTQPAERPQFQLFRAARAVDSGTIRADGQTIRIAGVLAPAADGRCADGTPCGEQAREALESWLAGREVLCALTAGAAEAPCVRGEEDIGEWIIANGWAEAAPGSVYAPAEEAARAERLGIWRAGGL